MSQTVYVSIGNSDDKLPQKRWSEFLFETDVTIREEAEAVHGMWYSRPDSPWQNACWCVEISNTGAEELKLKLAHVAYEFQQDSIAWARAATEFIKAAVE